MGYVIFVLGLVVGFVGGILVGRKNRVKVENVVAKVKEEYEERRG